VSQTTDRTVANVVLREAQGAPAADLVVVRDPNSPSAEAYRSLRASVKFAGLVPPVHSILIADAGTEGQHSLASGNLAAALALGGDRVVLVDANLRAPALHQLFGRANGDGVGEWLAAGDPDAPLPLVPTGVPGLQLVCAGHAPMTGGPSSASDLLSDDRCAILLDRLRGAADYVVIDAAPLSEVADALALAPRVDGVLLLIRSGRTKRVRAQRAKESLDRVGARVLGAVLTDAGGRSIFGR
jgi:non-specific protein-tyrosine kinase